MSWLDRFTPRRSRLESLLAAHKFREALEFVEDLPTDDRAEASLAIRRQAAMHWLAEADRACRDGDRSRMNGSMAEAARYHHDDFRPAFLETRRRIRDHTLSLTVAPHWAALIEAASIERNRLHDLIADIPAGFRTFRNGSLAAKLTADDISQLDSTGIAVARQRMYDAYPESLHPAIDGADNEFVRAALWVAVGRPDLAVPVLIELSDSDALVCLERARVAYALGQIGTTMLALGDFAIHHRGHATVRRLNTGVFMAQMAEIVGDAHRAVEILERVPLAQVGRRPVLLLARLYGQIGQPDRGRAVLDEWISGNPDDVEATVLRGAL